jgi:RNA polymerase sigma factor (sigma-70 family)
VNRSDGIDQSTLMASPSEGSAEDGEVIGRSLAEPRAFAIVFERHYARIWRYLCRRAGRTAADDLASETFLRAFSGRRDYDLARSDARPWLYGIATNLLREQSRREARRLRAYSRSPQTDSASDGLEEAEGRLDAAALAPTVAAALASLSPPDRDALLLLALTELDYEGIAVATGVPVGTVRSRLHRARRRIRLELELDLVVEGANDEQ